MKLSACLSGVYAATDESSSLCIEIEGQAGQIPYVRLAFGGDSERIAEWLADDIASEIALIRLAATAREVYRWGNAALPFEGIEWEEGPPPCISLWIDCGLAIFRGGISKNQIDVCILIYEDEVHSRYYTLRCAMKDVCEWGTELMANLNGYGSWG